MDDDDDINMEDLGRALFEAASLASNLVKHDGNNNTNINAKTLTLDPKSRKVDATTIGKIFISLRMALF